MNYDMIRSGKRIQQLRMEKGLHAGRAGVGTEHQPQLCEPNRIWKKGMLSGSLYPTFGNFPGVSGFLDPWRTGWGAEKGT